MKPGDGTMISPDDHIYYCCIIYGCLLAMLVICHTVVPAVICMSLRAWLRYQVYQTFCGALFEGSKRSILRGREN